ncbi:MAG TPA: M48 family metalloprotease, partial [Isosphaeraceae bacterium]|nr:M48 family metalloprotease [Isosphaeraceae bacterium]
MIAYVFSRRLFLLVVWPLLGLTWNLDAGVARAGAPARANARAAVPPACPHHRPVAPANPARRARPRGMSPFGFGPPGMEGMSELFGDMMSSMQNNPAGGFQDFLSQQEQKALQEMRISPAEERAIGKSLRDQYLRDARAHGFNQLNDADKLGYLQDLVDGFSQFMTHRDRYPKIEVGLIDAPDPDAQAFPGGFVVFSAGLLKEPDEASVAGVVAHELAHLDCGHMYWLAKRAKLADSAFQMPAGGPNGFDPSRFLSRGMAAGSVMMNPFKPELELEADCQSTTWMYLAGYDPRALVGYFERLHQ